MSFRLAGVLVVAAAFQFHQPAQSPVKLRATTTGSPQRTLTKVLDLPLASNAGLPATREWLQRWWSVYEVNQGGSMPLRQVTPKLLEVRFVAMPTDGVDCGVEERTRRLVAYQISSQTSSQARALAKEAVDRFVEALKNEAVECGFFDPQEKAPKKKKSRRPMQDPALYGGDYGDVMKESTSELFDDSSPGMKPRVPLQDRVDKRPFKDFPELNDFETEYLQSLFTKGEAMAKKASEERENTLKALKQKNETKKEEGGHAQFPVSFEGTGLQGGVDIFAGPSKEAKEDLARLEEQLGKPPIKSRNSMEKDEPEIIVEVPQPSPEIRVRFGVLLQEIMHQDDKAVQRLILDAYRDVLLDRAFTTLARDAMAATEKDDKLSEDEKVKRREVVGEALQILNDEVIKLATQLAELAAFAEQQHLETIRQVCDAARLDSDEAPLSLALRQLKPQFDDDFIGYLVYAINDEAMTTSPDQKDLSEWRLVLRAVKDIVYSFLAKESIADLKVIDNYVNLRDPEVRAKFLELNVEKMSPERLPQFLKVARNIFDNLLFADPDETTVERPDASVLSILHQLRTDLLDFVVRYHGKKYLPALTGEPLPIPDDLDGLPRPKLPTGEVIPEDESDDVQTLSTSRLRRDDDDDDDGFDTNDFVPIEPLQ